MTKMKAMLSDVPLVKQSCERKFRAFLRANAGVTAITFALMLPSILAVGAIAIEYTRIAELRARLDGAADAAAILAVKGARDALILASSMPPKSQNADQTYILNAAGRKAEDLLRAKARSATIAPKMKVTRTDNDLRAEASYTETKTTWFGRMVLGKVTFFTLSSTAVAAASLPIYQDIYVALDASESMGVGADDSDQQRMIDMGINPDHYGDLKPHSAGKGCVLACHHPSQDTYSLYRNMPNAPRLRIDVLKDALKKMVSSASSQADKGKTPKQFRFGFYTFGNALQEEVPTTEAANHADSADYYNYLAQKVDKIELRAQQYGTNFHDSLTALQAKMPAQNGKGLTADDPKIALVIITDGVENFLTSAAHPNPDLHIMSYDKRPAGWNYEPSLAWQAGSWGIQAFDPALCKPFKNSPRSFDVYYLNVKYVIPDRVGHELWTRMIKNGIPDVLPKSCPNTPDRFYSANSSAEINKAVDALFGAIAQNPRLIQ